VAARLLPSFGDPLGARVALLEVTRSMRKRAFSLSFLFFLVSGFTPRDQEGKGWGRRGHAFVLQVISQMILVQAETIYKTIGSACLASLPILMMFFVSKTHVQDALAKKLESKPFRPQFFFERRTSNTRVKQ
jgi:hypothetical protein